MPVLTHKLQQACADPQHDMEGRFVYRGIMLPCIA